MRLEAVGRSSESAGEAARPSSAIEPTGHQVSSSRPQKRSGSRARVAWYVRRLQCMSPQEILWRSSDVLRQRAWRLRQVPPTETAPWYLARFARDVYRANPKLAKAPRFESALPAGALDAVPADDVRR